MGSKARIAKKIAPILNSVIEKYQIDTYIEPFVGGANIIEHIECKHKYGIDINSYLIYFWKAIQSGWNPFSFEMTRESYEKIRDNKDDYPPEVVALAGLCATYNAKWFGGYAGIVNTKIGTQRNYYDEAVRNVLAQREKILDVKFSCRDYKTITKAEGALIYCDPPYQNTTGYKDDFNHDEFWDWIKLVSKNNYVFVSEYSAPNEFQCIFQSELTTTLDKSSRSQSTEKMFIHNNWVFNQLLKPILDEKYGATA